MTIKTWEDRMAERGANRLFTEAMQDEITELRARVAELEALSVTHILLEVVPGDGSGLEVYAESVPDVEARLSKLGGELEEWQLGIKRHYALEKKIKELEAELAASQDMANVGEALMHAIKAHADAGWHPSDCPSEIVGDLRNQRDELKAELAAIRNQEPVAYRAWFDKDSGARFLFTLWPEEEQLDVDWESLYLAAGAQPNSDKQKLLDSLIDANEKLQKHINKRAGVQCDTESVLIDGIAYTVPTTVACELLGLHLELQANCPTEEQPDGTVIPVDPSEMLKVSAQPATKTVDKAWSQFCGGIGRGPNAPYPGMIDAFEAHYGQSFTDKDWRNETGIWAAAWGHATRQAGAQPIMKDHEIASLVNRLTNIAKEYAGARQLRERIAQEIRPITKGAQPVPEGMALVPIEISEAMYEAYHKADNAAWCQMGASHGASIGDIWDAMLAAAKETK